MFPLISFVKVTDLDLILLLEEALWNIKLYQEVSLAYNIIDFPVEVCVEEHVKALLKNSLLLLVKYISELLALRIFLGDLLTKLLLKLCIELL